MKGKPTTIDEYLAGVAPEHRAALQKLRMQIAKAAPGAQECISYGLPTFRLNGKSLVAFGAGKNHCALYPASSTTTAQFESELKNFSTSKGAIRFQPDKPLPVALLRKLVKARMAENAARLAARAPKAQAPQDRPGVMAWLKGRGSARVRDEMGPRYGIYTDNAIGVPMADMIALARRIGPNHELAAQLWATGNYEARTVACMIDDPARVTRAQMNRWCRDFDNWGICDTACFKLFDRVPHAWAMVRPWAKREPEFQRRAAFALLACLALHDRAATDQQFLDHLPLLAQAASDRRNFVRKAVAWAHRAIARRNPRLKAAMAEQRGGSAP